ncbi:MAG: hypothetical protein PVF43_02075 [Candidatus Eiseniibacteriota bacterium]|jgi:hypothetical protein
MRVTRTARGLLIGTIGMITMLALATLPAAAQTPRQDVIWARVTPDPITLDGVLDEPAWNAAESIVVDWAEDAGIPGSGWKVEGGVATTDPTHATLKFLAHGNQIYLGAVVEDASVGGSSGFNRFDGFLMAVKDHLDPNFPKPPSEYLYSWWYPTQPDPQPPGQDPAFKGRWAEEPPGTPRTPEQIDAWDAVTVVDGLSNDDSVIDQGYTVEMRFDLASMGYDITVPEGDTFEWNISIYDCDWLWPLNAQQLSYNRVWWQGPWGNAAWYNEVRVFSRPDVTVSSGAVPEVGPEIVITEIDATAPIIDGVLDEPVWSHGDLYTFDIRYGDIPLRMTYPGVGPYRAGQYQPEVNGGQAFVVDPGDATVKIFFQGDILYMGFDVNDAVVQYVSEFDRWDGFLVSINDRAERGPDQNLVGRRLSFQVGEDGSAVPQDYLNTLVTGGGAEIGLALKAGTTVDTLGLQPDTGYTAELAIDLTELGYPTGLGDGALFISVNLLDGDSFTPFTDSYGTRTWWFREYESECCPVWAHLERTIIGIEPEAGPPTQGYALLRAVPNPSPYPTIEFSLPEASHVTLDVFDVAGRLASRRDLGLHAAGVRSASFADPALPGGVYFYRLELADPASGAVRAALSGKLVLLR